MPADYYIDAPETAPPPKPAPDEAAESRGAGKTAVLPKEFFGGAPPEPGTIFSLKVLRVHDTQVEVEDAGAEEEENPEEELPPAPGPGGGAGAMTGMDGMME